MRITGVEPVRSFPHDLLRVACLPISPYPRNRATRIRTPKSGFGDRRFTVETTALSSSMASEGVEPTRPFGQLPLEQPRLPFRHEASIALGGLEPPRPFGQPLLRRLRLPILPSQGLLFPIALEGVEPSRPCEQLGLSEPCLPFPPQGRRGECAEPGRASDAYRLSPFQCLSLQYGRRESNPQGDKAPRCLRSLCRQCTTSAQSTKKAPMTFSGHRGCIVKNVRAA